MKIRLKRAYEPADPRDGKRFLVDRIWPRGISKEDLHLTAWLKEVAPSTGLRRWFSHDPDKWEEFRRRYLKELAPLSAELKPLRDALSEGMVTLVYGARDEEHNNAVVLREFLAAE